MNASDQHIEQAALATQAAWDAYRTALQADMNTHARGTYAAREATLKAYRKAAWVENRLRNERDGIR